jgi:D-3-phosphoglycerate dehydrogenase/(S)-sulfolactate dehydrogenase
LSAKILVSDDLSPRGLEILKKESGLAVDVRPGLAPDALAAIVGAYDGLAVRSATKVTSGLLARADRLKVVGRAGIGVDNVDLEAATKRGIVVMNTPGGSSLTVAEHTFAMLLALVRHIPAATASIKDGKWEKKRFEGHELAGKTLGVVGIGNIGSVVVERARAFGMSVVAYDPFIAKEAAARLGATMVTLDELWPAADVVSLHVPLTESTRRIVNAGTLARMKQGAYLVNAARGGLVDEVALADALRSGKLAGAALDVFESEPPRSDHPLLALDNFVCTPHLGASTEEAQEAVAIQLAEQLVAFFRDGTIRNAVNVPSISRELLETLGPWLALAAKVGALAAQLVPGPATTVSVEYAGEITTHDLRALTAHVLVGLLSVTAADPVNEVNAPALARERGLTISEVRKPEAEDYASTIEVRLLGSQGSVSVVGTLFGKRDLRIVRVDTFDIDAVPEGNLLVLRNEDVPGIVGRIGTVLGDAGVNIARIQLSRVGVGGQAFSMINIDSPAPPEVLRELRGIPHVLSAAMVRL